MQYAFTLTGKTPILFHADDVEAADELKAWRKDPSNKESSVPGDDRSPAWSWQTYLYHDKEHLAIPQENILACLAKAGALIPFPKGRGNFKAASQSGLVIPAEYCEFRSMGKQVPVAPIHEIKTLPFAEQVAAFRKMVPTGGDENPVANLKVKRATVGASKHVRVRAEFRAWTVHGVVDVFDPIITPEVLAQMFEIGGRRIGLLDWRPGSPKKPGPYGTFVGTVAPLKARKAG